MKKMKSLWALLPVAVALIVASCSSEDAAEPASGNNGGTKTIPVKITVGMDDATRATVGSDNSTLYFHTADKLAVLFGGSLLGKLDMTVNNGTTATFEGTVTSTGDFSGSYNEVTVVLIGDENIGVRESDGTWVNNGPAICVANGNSSALNEAVKKYSYLTGTGTLGPGNLNNFTLTQHTAFLNIAVTFKDETAANTNLSVTVTNNSSTIGTGSVTTETDATSNDVVAKFVVPVAAGTVMSGATIVLGSSDPITLSSTATLAGQSYRIEKTLISGHEGVQLWAGGPYWATMNLGATNPEEYGKYFAWGETEGYYGDDGHYFGYIDYNNIDPQSGPAIVYKWANGGESMLTKYCNDSNYGYNGFTDNLMTLETADDAATANWGSGWRMPTSDEIEILGDDAPYTRVVSMEWVDNYKGSGVAGNLFTGIGPGYTERSIFLPAAGYCAYENGPTNSGSEGYYWSSSLSDLTTSAYILYIYGGDARKARDYRYKGLTIRAVHD